MIESGLRVPVKRLDTTLEMPRYAYVGDAGVDLMSADDVVLRPFERKLVSCGISMAIPEGHAGFVLPRSGLAIKHGISIVNAPGLIDSNYRGEIKVVLVNLDSQSDFKVAHGDRIAQLVIMPVPIVRLAEVDALDETERGTGGFGSSGISENLL